MWPLSCTERSGPSSSLPGCGPERIGPPLFVLEAGLCCFLYKGDICFKGDLYFKRFKGDLYFRGKCEEMGFRDPLMIFRVIRKPIKPEQGQHLLAAVLQLLHLAVQNVASNNK